MRDKKTWHINNFCSWTRTIFFVHWELTESADILYLYCLFALLTRPSPHNGRMQHDGKMMKIKVKIARLSAFCQLSHNPLFFAMCAVRIWSVLLRQRLRQLASTRFISAADTVHWSPSRLLRVSWGELFFTGVMHYLITFSARGRISVFEYKIIVQMQQ